MLGGTVALDWLAFAAAVVGVMVADWAAFGRVPHEMRFREAALRSAMLAAFAAAFAGFVLIRRGADRAADFTVAYLVEQSLSIDNLFVFLVVFSYFKVPQARQQRVLFWGIVGAVIMRGVFVVLGAAMLRKFEWAIYPFGAFLAWTGFKLGFGKEDDEAVDPSRSLVLKPARRFLRITSDFDGDHFFIQREGLRWATPLFLVLLVIEFSDVIFAVDSVPAVLAVSDDLYVVYTSNIFAILGLRALFFLLAGMMSRFKYLDVGLAFILIFIGAKMMASHHIKIPSLVSLGVIVGVLALSVTVSLLRAPDDEE